jgi:hypothetical protein
MVHFEVILTARSKVSLEAALREKGSVLYYFMIENLLVHNGFGKNTARAPNWIYIYISWSVGN